MWPGKYTAAGERRRPRPPASTGLGEADGDPVAFGFTARGEPIDHPHAAMPVIGASRPTVPAHRLLQGDLRAALPSLAPGSVDFAYFDPPFGTGRTHRATLAAEGWRTDTDWADTSDATALIELLDDAIQLIHPLLKPTGVIAVHTDHRAAAWVRCLLDEHFGASLFINELIWKYGLGNATARRYFLRKHDTIAVYGRSPEYHFAAQRGALTPAQERKYRHHDEHGRYMLSYGRKYYLKGGKPLESVLEIPALAATDRERCGYPTQKPIHLVRTLIRSFCPPGGVVLDCTCGSGTTGLATMDAGEDRHWIMIDRSPAAIAVVQERLARRLAVVESGDLSAPDTSMPVEAMTEGDSAATEAPMAARGPNLPGDDDLE